jgi:aminoglycoside phosphotransferase (APT) family kinase protein
VGPDLCAASAMAPLAGDALLHFDVRSDNLCIRGASAVLFDWNLARVGNPLVDIAFWLPSLASESGMPPEDVLPDCPPELIAYVAGFFASRAGQPVIPHAPRVRQAQLEQLRAALPWAVRALDLGLP